MQKLYGSKEKGLGLPIRERVFYIALVMVGFFLISSASSDLIAEGREYTAAYSEYEQLRESYPVITTYRPTAPQLPTSNGTGNDMTIQSKARDSELTIDTEADLSTMPDNDPQIPDSLQEDLLAGLAEENPDFVGWISIEGVIDYPVVRGRDNSRYLRVTFTGQRSGSGAIFMDYRNTMGFSEPVCLLYGHNMRDGSMFAPLNRYADPAFLADHPDITIVTSNGKVLEYRIFAAKQVYDRDATYDLDFADAKSAAKAFSGAPEGAINFLLLSTCTPSIEKSDRMLVFAALVG